ncbi:MAG: glycoside hydrolase family 18 protein, partial [Bacteroidota bacterium]
TASLILNHVLMSEGLMSEATTEPSSQSSYVLGNQEQWWFETPENLNTKYQWVREQQMAGVGIWALGYDNGFDNWWQVLRDNFSTHASPLPAGSAVVMDNPADSAGADTSGIVGEVVALASKLAVFMVDHSSFWQQLRLLVAVLVLFVFILLVQACLDAAVREALEANATLKNVVLVLLIGLPLLFLWLLGLFASVTGWMLVLAVLAIVGGVYLLQNVILKPVPESC